MHRAQGFHSKNLLIFSLCGFGHFSYVNLIHISHPFGTEVSPWRADGVWFVASSTRFTYTFLFSNWNRCGGPFVILIRLSNLLVQGALVFVLFKFSNDSTKLTS